MRYAFVFDQNRCTGCHACQLACTIENRLPLTLSWRHVLTFNAGHHPGLPVFHLSLACNHCGEPACLEACPAAAYRIDQRTGAVLLEEDQCIGCRYCSWACPYDAPVFDDARGVMTKCTFCVERLRDGKQPACAAACPTSALRVATLEEETLTTSAPGLPDLGLRPGIRIEGWKGHGGQASAHGTAAPPAQPVRRSKVSLRNEWSLAAFTMIAALLLGAYAGAEQAEIALHHVAFAAVAAAGMLVSSVHLRRKDRAWRAVLHVRRSWLSREVAGFLLFAVLGTLELWLWPDVAWLGKVVTAVGALALLSADRVYAVVRRAEGAVPHSSSVLLSGVLLAAVVAGSPAIAGLLGAAALGLYAYRKRRFVALGLDVRPVLTGLRVLLGFVLPALLWLGDGRVTPLLLGAVVFGLAVDRAEFYSELEVITPASHLARHEANRIAIARRWGESVAA